MREFHKWTQEEVDYLTEITYGRYYDEIIKLMTEKFNYDFSRNQIKSAVYRHNLTTGFTGRFEKGHKSWNKGTKGLCKSNKTSFKKGNVPKNFKPVGSERVNIYGYIEIKVADPNTWKLKHRVIYEQHHGKIPKNHVVLFADSDKSNVSIDNLILINKAQLFKLNQLDLIKQDAELTKVGVNVASLLVQIDRVSKSK